MQHWSKVEHPVGEPRPKERSNHASVCLGYGGDHSQLLVTGGYYYGVLNDVWVLDVESGHWREVSVLVVMGVYIVRVSQGLKGCEVEEEEVRMEGAS